ncbi:hypothetical protein [Alloalcanivorax xenomutans]|uniref:hypothetical protein n=1 Tax=Alloalcanivorax xenomutans TaxID=1094342 RepID=UPI003BADBA19
MNKKALWGLVLSGIFACGSAYAEGTPGHTGKFSPESVEVLEQYVLVRVSQQTAQNLQNVDNCVNRQILAINLESGQKRQEMLSVVLAALTSGQPVAAYISECVPVHWDAASTVPSIETIFLHKK